MPFSKTTRLTSLTLALIAVSQTAMARDVAVCADLYRRLNSVPQTIGTSSNIRRYAQDLSAMNADIRQLRIDMHNLGCGGGSIIAYGEAVDEYECRDMADTLDRLEQARADLAEQRNSTRSLLQPSEERVAILSAIRANNCTPTDLDTQTKLDDQERMRIKGLALPGPDDARPGGTRQQDASGSSITHLGSSRPTVDPAPPPVQLQPDRAYDPERKVRSVGPQFFPDENIDLANPRSAGPQQQQP